MSDNMQQGAEVMERIEVGTTTWFTIDIAVAFGVYLASIKNEAERERQTEEFMERCQWLHFKSEGCIWEWLERWQDEAAGGEPDWSDWLRVYCKNLRAQWVGP